MYHLMDELGIQHVHSSGKALDLMDLPSESSPAAATSPERSNDLPKACSTLRSRAAPSTRRLKTRTGVPSPPAPPDSAAVAGSTRLVSVQPILSSARRSGKAPPASRRSRFRESARRRTYPIAHARQWCGMRSAPPPLVPPKPPPAASPRRNCPRRESLRLYPAHQTRLRTHLEPTAPTTTPATYSPRPRILS
jgi:hypothetical protein